MKKRHGFLSLALLIGFAQLHAAVSLYDADSLWLFDQGVLGGAASHTQVIDSTIRGHVASSNNFAGLSWTAGPSAGPYGGSAHAPTGHAIKFTPVVTVPRPGRDAGQLDTVQAAAFAVSNGNVSGNATVVTRMRWDGAIPGFDDGNNQWLMNNGLQSWNDTSKVSGGFLMGLQTDGRLAYYTAAPGTGQTGVGAAHSFNTPELVEARLAVGEWYDIAMVVDDLGTINDATGRVTFYMVGADGIFRSYSSAGTMWVGNASATALTIGAESGGVGTTNQRKSFNGALDYLAMYDEALTEAQVRHLFAVPEPSRGLLLLAGMIPLLAWRRRS